MEGETTVSRRYAGFWCRLAAFSLDGLILGVLCYLASLAMPGLVHPIADRVVPQPSNGRIFYHSFPALLVGRFTPVQAAFLVSVIVSLALLLAAGYLIVFVVLTSRKGGTPGKLLLRLRVIDVCGDRISLKTALLRHTIGYLTSAVGAGLGFLWIALDERKQGWHDKIAKTFVIRV